MDDFNSFGEVLTELKARSQKRDPKSSRLAAVTSALTDVIEGDVTAAKVFASAFTTLEGTLHQEHQEVSIILDSLNTQAALLELIRQTIAHVAPATVSATTNLTSRVLRSIVNSCRTVSLDETRGEIFDTKDGLGAISSVLCASSKAVGELLRALPATTDQKAVRQLLNATLITMIQDPRSKVKNTARDELCGLLNMESPMCHPSIRSGATKYVQAKLDALSKKASNEDFIDLLGFLQLSIMSMDFQAIGARLMEVLTNLMAECSSLSSSTPVFIAKSKDSTGKILNINAILSTVLAMLENDVMDSRKEKLSQFSARVLATLIQARPTLTFRDGNAEWDLLESGRTIYGQVVLSACQRLLTDGNYDTGCKLLPLAIQQILNLSKPTDEESESSVADTLFLELSQLCRSQLKSIQVNDSKKYEKCTSDSLAVLQLVLQPTYQQTWSVSLKTLSILLQQMDHDDEAVATCVQSLVKQRCRTDEDKASHTAVEEALSALIQAIGIEKFWEQADLTDMCSKLDGSPNELAWVFRTMKSSGSMSGECEMHISFFQTNILPLARHYDNLSLQNPKQATLYRSQVLDLWALFPIFCRRPSDLVTDFPKLAPILVRAMNDERYPQLIESICNGLSVLSNGVSQRVESFEELVEGDEAADSRLEQQLVSKLSEKMLPSLFKLVDTLHDRETKPANDDGEDAMAVDKATDGNAEQAGRVRAVALAIASLSKVAPKQLLQTLFSKVLQRLLEASQSDNDLSDKMCSLLTLSQALVTSQSLDQASITLLYRSLKPLIRTDETRPRIQKRAYKVLAEICTSYPAFVTEKNQLKELVDLLSASTATSQVSARSMRIKCLNQIVNALGETDQPNDEIISSLVGETLLCLKDSNGKTRDAAYKLLLSMAKVQNDPTKFIQLVTAAVASKTPHMRSASLMALSRLVFEYAKEDQAVQNLLPSLLSTVLILSDDPSREVVKGLVGFVRVTVVAASPEQLQPLLPDILNSLLKYHRGKDRFRAKIKIIIKKLVKLFGYETLMPMVPQSDSRLLTHMRKLSEREVRRKNRRRGEINDQRTVAYDEMIASDEEDSDDGRTLMTSATRLTKMTAQSKRTLKRRRGDDAKSAAMSRKSRSDVTIRLRNDRDGNVLDVSDLAKKSVRFAEGNSDDSDSDAPIEFDMSGKLVVPDDNSEADSIDKFDDLLSQSRSRARSNNRDDASQKERRGKQQKRGQKLGAAYKSKKAGGDVKKKGQKYDPYAYMPLDGRSYTKKNRRQTVEQMGSVVHRGRKRQRR